MTHETRVWSDDRFRIRLGSSQWDNGTDRSVAFCWRDVNGRFSRGTIREFPASALAPMVLFALAHGYLTWDDFRSALRDITSEAVAA